jgi:hypothetical protein
MPEAALQGVLKVCHRTLENIQSDGLSSGIDPGGGPAFLHVSGREFSLVPDLKAEFRSFS